MVVAGSARAHYELTFSHKNRFVAWRMRWRWAAPRPRRARQREGRCSRNSWPCMGNYAWDGLSTYLPPTHAGEGSPPSHRHQSMGRSVDFCLGVHFYTVQSWLVTRARQSLPFVREARVVIGRRRERAAQFWCLLCSRPKRVRAYPMACRSPLTGLGGWAVYYDWLGQD